MLKYWQILFFQINITTYTCCIELVTQSIYKSLVDNQLPNMAVLSPCVYTYKWPRKNLLELPKEPSNKARSWHEWILRWGLTMVTAVFKSMGDEWRNTLKPNMSTPHDLWWRTNFFNLLFFINLKERFIYSSETIQHRYGGLVGGCG